MHFIVYQIWSNTYSRTPKCEAHLHANCMLSKNRNWAHDWGQSNILTGKYLLRLHSCNIRAHAVALHLKYISQHQTPATTPHRSSECNERRVIINVSFGRLPHPFRYKLIERVFQWCLLKTWYISAHALAIQLYIAPRMCVRVCVCTTG